nr:MAG TPA: hypothetical protein [Caudoviricetes sp.]
MKFKSEGLKETTLFGSPFMSNVFMPVSKDSVAILSFLIKAGLRFRYKPAALNLYNDNAAAIQKAILERVCFGLELRFSNVHNAAELALHTKHGDHLFIRHSGFQCLKLIHGKFVGRGFRCWFRCRFFRGFGRRLRSRFRYWFLCGLYWALRRIRRGCGLAVPTNRVAYRAYNNKSYNNSQHDKQYRVFALLLCAAVRAKLALKFRTAFFTFHGLIPPQT